VKFSVLDTSSQLHGVEALYLWQFSDILWIGAYEKIGGLDLEEKEKIHLTLHNLLLIFFLIIFILHRLRSTVLQLVAAADIQQTSLPSVEGR
jgi:hypothetical protein